MTYFYDAILTKDCYGRKVKETIIYDVKIIEKESCVYPFVVIFDGQLIGSAKTLENAEKLAKHNFGMTYKLIKK